MFILDTDHISLFQRSDPHVSARVLETPPQELATTVITVEEQLRGRLDLIHRGRSDEGWSEPIVICSPRHCIFAGSLSSVLMNRLKAFSGASEVRAFALERTIYGLLPLPSVTARP